MFSFFKRKKIYCVEYRDNWNDYHRVIVEAINPAHAWKKLTRNHLYDSPYKPAILISIKEVKD